MTATDATGPLTVYWDGSKSMLGYVDASTNNLRPLGDAEALLVEYGKKAGGSTRWVKFGKTLHDVADPSDLPTHAGYVCHGATNCDNLDSPIDTILAAIADDGKHGLNVVVTDLWLSNRAFVGSPQVALGGPIRRILAQGQAIGLVGLRSPYTGPIYDMPSHTNHLGAHERPLFLILVGSPAQVTEAASTLTGARSPAFAPNRVRFSMFVAKPRPHWLGLNSGLRASGAATPTTVDADVPSPLLPQFSLAPGAEGAISAHFELAGVQPPGAVWTGAPTGATRAWLLQDASRLKRCEKGAWEPFGFISGTLKKGTDAPTAVDFQVTDASLRDAGLLSGRTYYVQTVLGVTSLNVPNRPADDWIRAWGFGPEDEQEEVSRHPAFFKTLGLGEVAGLLEQGVNDAAVGEPRNMVSFGFLVRQER